MDLGLSDRVYVVAGASRGLGRACALQLAVEGARLVLCGRNEASLAVTAKMIGGPERAIAVSGDISEAGLDACLAAAAVARYGRLDGVLVGTGEPQPRTLAQTSDGDWRLAFETAFLGPLRLARTVADNVSHEGGSVVLLLSPSARHAPAGQALGNGLHPGLAMAARTMADELGPRNVRVNLVLPGLCDTERTRDADEAEGGEPARRRNEERIPLRRYGDALELARPAVFLLSPAASYVTGAVLSVDGGLNRTW